MQQTLAVSNAPYAVPNNAALGTSLNNANTQSSEISAFVGNYSTMGKAGINAAQNARKDFISFASGIQQFGTTAGRPYVGHKPEVAISHSNIREFGVPSTSSSPTEAKMMMAFMRFFLEMMYNEQANTEATSPQTNGIHPEWTNFEVMNRAYQCACGG
jgi:hypothetical protein